jgi:hypothetical protein
MTILLGFVWIKKKKNFPIVNYTIFLRKKQILSQKKAAFFEPRAICSSVFLGGKENEGKFASYHIIP